MHSAFVQLLTRRYLWSRSANQPKSASRRGKSGLWLATMGIALGVASLIVVLSVMNGFAAELQLRLLQWTPHVVIESESTNTSDSQMRTRVEQVVPSSRIQTLQPAFSEHALLVHNQAMQAVVLERWQADLPKQNVLWLDDQGTDAPSGLIVPQRLWRQWSQSHALDVWLPGVALTENQKRESIPRLAWQGQPQSLPVAGVYDVGVDMGGLPRVWISDATLALLQPDRSNNPAWQVRLTDPLTAPRVAKQLSTKYPAWQVSHWGEQQTAYFQAVKVEKWMMFFILMLIVAIAVLNIVTSLVMLVKHKQSDIAILRTMGAKRRSILSTFFHLGLFTGTAGVLVGTAVGTLIAWKIGAFADWIESVTGWALFPGDIYLITGIPSKLIWSDVAWVAGMALLLSLLAAWYPAHRAACIAPARALRSE